jgi:N-formylglutamate deformylase
MPTQPYLYRPGTVPLIVSMPHTAAYVPAAILDRFVPAAKQLPDTDWHIDRLYGFAGVLGAHMLTPSYSRYVVDLNRAPDNASLYPGKFTTGICPTTLFDGAPLYQEGQAPDEKEIARRIDDYWQPYHDKLQSLIDELKAQHGRVALFDAHSICSQVPTLFTGVLPDLNFGTADGKTADAALCEKLLACAKRSDYSVVDNGRFKGGYITRHYGNPAQGVQAVQLELAQKNYMQETHPFAYDEAKAGRLQAVLQALLSIIIEDISAG